MAAPETNSDSIQDPELTAWWPTTQSLDLVQGSIEIVASAVLSHFQRLAGDQGVKTFWLHDADLDDVFSRSRNYANVSTNIAVIPTRSDWTVLWNNSFLCDGYDSLCWNLTRSDRLTTIHWSAHDVETTFQPGSQFTHRRMQGDEMQERSVYCAKNDSRWIFHESGTPLPEEETARYAERKKSERLNEGQLLALLSRLDAHPWRRNFYALPEKPVFVMSRETPPAATIRPREAVLIPRHPKT